MNALGNAIKPCQWQSIAQLCCLCRVLEPKVFELILCVPLTSEKVFWNCFQVKTVFCSVFCIDFRTSISAIRREKLLVIAFSKKAQLSLFKKNCRFLVSITLPRNCCCLRCAMNSAISFRSISFFSVKCRKMNRLCFVFYLR